MLKPRFSYIAAIQATLSWLILAGSLPAQAQLLPASKCTLQLQTARTAPLEGRVEIQKSSGDQPLDGNTVKFEPRLRAWYQPMAIDKSVPLKGRVDRLADGTKLFALRDEALFSDSEKRLIPETATADVTVGFINRTVYRAFLKMDCLEFTDLGANYYTAPEFYKPLEFGGRSIVIGASSSKDGPTLKFTIGRRIQDVCMSLAGLNRDSHNVMVVTDGLHMLAIDPRTHDSWRLNISMAPNRVPFSWTKLTHNHKATCPLTAGGTVKTSPLLACPANAAH